MLKYFVAFLLLAPVQALANDTMAQMKTGGLTVKMTAEDFYPTRDLDILILKPCGQ